MSLLSHYGCLSKEVACILWFGVISNYKKICKKAMHFLYALRIFSFGCSIHFYGIFKESVRKLCFYCPDAFNSTYCETKWDTWLMPFLPVWEDNDQALRGLLSRWYVHGAPINVNGNPTVKHSDWRQEAEGMVGPLILNFFIAAGWNISGRQSAEANNQPYLKSAMYVDVLSINSLYKVYICSILLYKKSCETFIFE